MRILVPFLGRLHDADAKLVRLCDFLGIPCDTLSLAEEAGIRGIPDGRAPSGRACLVVNPRVLKEWLGTDGIPGDLLEFVLSRFSRLFVHALRPEAFDDKLVSALSRGRLKAVGEIPAARPPYRIAEDSGWICEAFSGLSFGPADPANDHVFSPGSPDDAVLPLISIGGRPFLASVRTEGNEAIFLAGENVADLDAEAGDAPLAAYFSRLLPHAMALRHFAGDGCWRPSGSRASIVIDDPLLRERYGFLHFESLLRMADRSNFHAAIAFIPYNYRRGSARTTRLFRENGARLSICYHGNDHTSGEFAATSPGGLNTLLRTAEERMDLHRRMTGLPCDRVMVFPQGRFSVAAMGILKSRNFLAAVNTVPYPEELPARLTIGELAQPAVLRYGGFPLFLRRPARQIQDADIAFNHFFGRPVLIVEHHEIFRNPEALAEIASRINAISPNVRWSGLAEIAAGSMLARTAPDGTYHVRPYSGAVRIANDTESPRRCSIEWALPCDGSSVAQVIRDGTSPCGFGIENGRLRLSTDSPPGSSHTFALDHRNPFSYAKGNNLRQKAKVLLRRRLSEFRDNYLSRNPGVLTAAKTFQRIFLKI